MSVLLRQPHGFEGRSTFGVDHQSYYLATSHCRDVRGTRLRLHATSFSCSANVNEDHDLIAHVEESLGFHPQVVPNLKEALHQPPYFFVTATNTDVEAALGQVHLDVGVKGLKEGINVAAIPRLESLARELHVLPGHRPRSIPQAQESA